MKKILFLSLIMLCTAMSAWSQTTNNVVLQFDEDTPSKTTNPETGIYVQGKPYTEDNNSAWKVDGDNALELSVPQGYVITKVEFGNSPFIEGDCIDQCDCLIPGTENETWVQEDGKLDYFSTIKFNAKSPAYIRDVFVYYHRCSGATHHDAVPSTCTTKGRAEYWECTCGKIYSDADCTNMVTDMASLDTEIDPTNHSGALEEHALVEATCTKDGNVYHWHCNHCYKNFETEDAKEEITDVIISKELASHNNLEYVKAKAATVTEIGYTVNHWHCKDCGKNFENQECTTPITDDVIIPATNYLCFTAEVDNSMVKLYKQGNPNAVKMEYSKDECATWTTVNFADVSSTGEISLPKVGDKVYFRKADDGVAAKFSTGNSDFYQFTMEGTIAASGNIMSLIDNSCKAKAVSEYCFFNLFRNCTSLTTAPDLPATTLAPKCYFYLFENCTNLKKIKVGFRDWGPFNPRMHEYDCTYGWVRGVGPDGDFICPENMPKYRGSGNIPNNWTINGSNVSHYLCFTAEKENSYVCLKKTGQPKSSVTIEYSTDECATWTTVNFADVSSTGEISLPKVGDKVYFRRTGELSGFSDNTSFYHFSMGGQIAGSGNVMALIFNNPEDIKNLESTIQSFYLTRLFYDCKALTKAPEFNFPNVSKGCYSYMFKNCTSLETAPELPATTLAEECYEHMFSHCINLKTAPMLPATTLENGCYYCMFGNCTSLETAPELPATTLAEDCYREMFSFCESLRTAPELPATTLSTRCYMDMFNECRSLTTAPELPAEGWLGDSYMNMFNNCSRLNLIKVSFTEWEGNGYWLGGVAETGTFICPDALDKTQRSAECIPEGWTIVFEAKANKDPESENYYSTFYSGTNAYQVPEGVTAYTGVVEESASNSDVSVLNLTAIESGIIPAGEPVILRATQSQVYLPYTTTSATKSGANELTGTDVAKTLGTNDYALSFGQYGVGFYDWSGRTIDAHKAYLTLPGSQLAPGRSFGMVFDDGTFTGIPATIIDQPQDDIIYNLQGQRVDESYRGLIIKNGQKVYNY